MLGIIGILLGFAILLGGVWKKYSLILVSLIASGVIGITNGATLTGTWNGPFLEGITTFAAPFFWMLTMGALFAKLMEDSNATKSIGRFVADKFGEKNSLLGYFIVTALLTYGGVNGFVIVFVLLPLAKVLFSRGNVPWYLFPAVTYCAMVPGCAFFPGGIQTNNMAPTQYLGTSLTAAPVIGIIGTVIYLLLSGLYIRYALKKGRENPDAFDYTPSINMELLENEQLPGVLRSVLPMVIALVAINILKLHIVYGLIIACVACLILLWPYYPNKVRTLNDGVTNGISPVILVAMVVGIAKVVAATPTFAAFQGWLYELPFSGLFKVFSVTNAVAFMTGSGTAAISTTLDLFGADFLSMGYSAETIHRIVAMSSEGFDSMPWNSFIVLVTSMAGLSYSSSYKHVFALSVFLTGFSTIITILLMSFF